MRRLPKGSRGDTVFLELLLPSFVENIGRQKGFRSMFIGSLKAFRDTRMEKTLEQSCLLLNLKFKRWCSDMEISRNVYTEDRETRI